MATTIATKLIDFANVGEGWHVHSCAIGPTGDLTLLAADQPPLWRTAVSSDPFDPPPVRPPDPSGYRLVHLAEGREARSSDVLDLPGTEQLLTAGRFIDGRWLTIAWPSPADGGPQNAAVRGDLGDVITTFRIGVTGHVQLTSDGRIWTGYGDESIWTSDDLEWGGVVCVNDHGRSLFRFNVDVANEPSVPVVWCAGGINVVTDDEVWLTFYAYVTDTDPGAFNDDYVLVRLDGYRVAQVWPWQVVTDKAPARPPGAFAVDGGRLLLQGSGYGLRRRKPDADHPNARLYLVPLSDEPASDLLPVDERGDWIGPFRSEGRGTKLYLTTDSGLFAVDLSVL